jgi:phage-related protein
VGREIEFFEEHFLDFYLMLKPEIQKKIEFVLNFIRQERILSERFLKKIHGYDKLYEIRVQTDGKAIRIFSTPNSQNWILLNAFIKKTQKTPSKELFKANRLKTKYEKSKKFNGTT